MLIKISHLGPYSKGTESLYRRATRPLPHSHIDDCLSGKWLVGGAPHKFQFVLEQNQAELQRWALVWQIDLESKIADLE